MSSGIVVALIRVSEPFVWTNIKADINYLGFKCCNKKRAKFSEESLDSFLNSAMNIEYVYLLLLGINTYLEKDTDLEHEKKMMTSSKNNQSKIILTKLEFKNASKWNVNQGAIS